MCEFCENIRNDTDFSTLEPHLIYGNWCGNNEPMFYINIPTDEGKEYSVDNIKFCPYCGRKLSEVSGND